MCALSARGSAYLVYFLWENGMLKASYCGYRKAYCLHHIEVPETHFLGRTNARLVCGQEPKCCRVMILPLCS